MPITTYEPIPVNPPASSSVLDPRIPPTTDEERAAAVRTAVAAFKADGGAFEPSDFGDLYNRQIPCCVIGAVAWALTPPGGCRANSYAVFQWLGVAWGLALESGFEDWGPTSPKHPDAFELGASISREAGLR